jgi:outer membrane protein TolC
MLAVCLLCLGAGTIRAGAQPPAGALTILDAARVTIASQAEIQLQQQQVAFSRSTLQAVRGQFDPTLKGTVLRARDTLPLATSQILQTGGLFESTITNTTLYRANLEKQFRSGLVVAPALEMVRQDLNYEPTASNRANVTLGVTQPLLRGRGTEIVTAAETAARLEVEASELDLQQVIASAVERTLEAYWLHVAALRGLQVLRDVEGRAGTLVTQVETLIQGGQRPAADLKQVQANLANRVAQRAASDLALVTSRQQLGLAMGISTVDIAALSLPGDPFPVVDADDAASIPATTWFIDEARRRRTDLQAFQQRRQQAQVLRLQARDALKPQLDLSGSVGYAGLDEGSAFSRFLTPFAPGGFNAAAGLVLEWPTLNNEAIGVLGRRESAHAQIALQAAELDRRIVAGVTAAAEAVRQSAVRVRSARVASALYRSAVTDEWEKLQLGLSTIIDLILTEDRATQSLLAEIDAETAHAIALARLRLETGTLVGAAGGPVLDPARMVDRDRLTRVPEPERP